jgi:hypothetical protein
MSGVIINGSIGSRIGPRIDSRNVFEWSSPKRELDRKNESCEIRVESIEAKNGRD